jgi:hypothetical protein
MAKDGSEVSSIERTSSVVSCEPAGRSRTTWRTATRRSAVENTRRTTPTAVSDIMVPIAIRIREREEGRKPVLGATTEVRKASARVALTISAALTH